MDMDLACERALQCCLISNLLLLIAAGCSVGGCTCCYYHDHYDMRAAQLTPAWPLMWRTLQIMMVGVVYWCHHYCLHYTVHLQHLSTCCQPPLIYTPILQLIIRGSEGRGGLLGIIMTGNMQQTVYFRYKFTGEQILSKYLIASAGGNWILFGVWAGVGSIFMCNVVMYEF